MGSEQDIANHVNIAADEEEMNNIGEYSSDDEQIDDFLDDEPTGRKNQDIPDQDDLIEPSIQDDTLAQQMNLEQDEDQENYESSIDRAQARERYNRFRQQQRGPRLNRQIDDDDDEDEADDDQEEDSTEVIVESIIGNNVETDLENGTHGDDEYDTVDQEIYSQINR